MSPAHANSVRSCFSWALTVVWHAALHTATLSQQSDYSATAGLLAGSREGSPPRQAGGEISAAISPRCGADDNTTGIVDAAAFASEQTGGDDGAAAPVCDASTPGDAPTRSPKAGMSGGQQSPGGSKGGSPGGMGVGVFRSLLRGTNSGSGARMSRSNSGAQPTCLICLEPLTSEDFLVRFVAKFTLQNCQLPSKLHLFARVLV